MKNNPSDSKIGRVFTSIFNIRLWIDWDRTKSYVLYLFFGIKKFLVPQAPERSESFAEAQTENNLTDKDLLVKQNALYRLSLLMIGFAFGMLLYTVYQMVQGSLFGIIVSFIVMLMALVFAFRYHFWYFQIKERKLGCSLSDWFRRGIMGDKQ